MSDLPAGPGGQEGAWPLRGLFLERPEAPGTHPEGAAGGRRAEQAAAAPLKPSLAPQPRAAPHGACAGFSTEIPGRDPASASGAAENQGLKGKEQRA
ncbi:unnamed protein product [Rangifer tarandus platyrhynchus]|uniref:Uncharacterized protein n=3 Tax=Rangifer tarandus platyrhynchus TaxID=3082113 RepID=A0ACB0FMH3_RANTA|nr:unnamed protein product [Rangifer tarandus platyrhynchus]CAI9714335.1 unnamed protein product [Rangifer tarandus platyrhynchus]